MYAMYACVGCLSHLFKPFFILVIRDEGLDVKTQPTTTIADKTDN